MARLGVLFPGLARQDDVGLEIFDESETIEETGRVSTPEVGFRGGRASSGSLSNGSVSGGSLSGGSIPRRQVVQESLTSRVRRFTSQHVKVLSSLALVAVIFATWMVMRARAVPLDEPSEPTESVTWVEPVPSPTAIPEWRVHVLGAVVNPGVVVVPQGARVIDAIEAAGGFTGEADPGELNLAAVLVDGSQIVIGVTGEPVGEVRQGANWDGDPGSPSTSDSTTINLNQATETELDTLPGVGPVTAKAILSWRDKNGPFTSVSQLQEVDGIGPKTFAQIEPYVSV